MKEAIALLEKALAIKAKISLDYSEHTIKLAADEMMVCIVDALSILKQPKAQPSSEFVIECRETELDEWSDWRIKELCDRLDTSEARLKKLLKQPKCKTCGDSREIKVGNVGEIYEAFTPCPKCQQPKAQPISEFTKEVRINFTTHFENPDWVNHKKLMEACKIIDESEASRKELLDNLKMLVALLCHPGSFVSAEDIEKAKAAISNEKKGIEK